MLRLLLPCLLFSAACSTPTKPAAQTTPTAPKPPRITHFYSNANPVAPGQSATLCYGTDDATEVTLAPYDDTLKPSMNRCIAVTPTRPTTYTLTAKGPGGQTTSTLSIALAILFYPLHLRIHHALRRPGLAAGLSIVLVIALLLLPS
ncbi:MAG: hypothetical protein ACK6D7_00860, partial [Acidobacteriota bacterium]